MREACLDKRARDVELRKASMDTFTPVVLELLAREFRISRRFSPVVLELLAREASHSCFRNIYFLPRAGCHLSAEVFIPSAK